MSKEDRVSRTLLHINDLYCEISVINPPAMGCWIRFVYLNGEKLYAVANETLYVYLMIDTTSPVATYSLSSDCYSGEIFNNRLYLGGKNYLDIFDITTSLVQPLTPVTKITTKGWVYKVLSVGHSLILGEDYGYLEVFDI
jgi:hypothetical protein